MIVKESIDFVRGKTSKEALGLGETALINNWLKNYVENNRRGYPSKEPFRYKIDPGTKQIKLMPNSVFWPGAEIWPTYITNNLDTRSKFLVGVAGNGQRDLIRKSFDEGFIPSISLFKNYYNRIHPQIGDEKFRDLILHLFPGRLPNDLTHLAKQNFSEEEIEKYFDNRELFRDKNLIDRSELERKQDYEQAEMDLEKARFYITTTDRQRKNGTIASQTPRGRDYTMSIGGRVGQKGQTSNLYNNSKTTYRQMAQLLIDREK